MNTNVKRNEIRFINDTTAIVSKAFMKRAAVYGTFEYKLLRGFKAENPDVTVCTKETKRTINEATTTKNLSYENMAAYINTLETREIDMSEFRIIVLRSKSAANPYRAVVAWFKGKYDGINSYIKFFEEIAKKKEAEKDIFALRDVYGNLVNASDEV